MCSAGGRDGAHMSPRWGGLLERRPQASVKEERRRMSERLTSLLDDLHLLVQELDEQQKKQDNKKGPEKDQAAAQEPDTVPASNTATPDDSNSKSSDEKKTGEGNDLIIRTDSKAAGVIIGVGVDENSPIQLERFEVTPEPDGRVRIIVSAKKKEL
jgi:hypothetical protein